MELEAAPFPAAQCGITHFSLKKTPCNRKAGAAFAPVASETKGGEDPMEQPTCARYLGRPELLTAWLLPVNGDSKEHKDW